MQTMLRPIKIICILSLPCTLVWAHSENPSGNSPSLPKYSLSSQISLDPDLESIRENGRETESSIIYYDESNNNNTTNNNNNNKIYKDNSDINVNDNTPHALFFHGGEMVDSQPFVAMAECAFMPRTQDQFEFDLDELDDDDEDDDDQDDGHSSMLSNSSIKRRVSVSGSGTSYQHNSNGGNKNIRKFSSSPKLSTTITTFANQLRGSESISASLSLKKYNILRHNSMGMVLNLRGGAQLSDEFAKRLITAATVTLLYEGILGHILEFLKIAMQTADSGTTYTSIIKSITSEKGIGGLWDGFVPWGVMQSVFKGGVFGLAHAVAKAYLSPFAEKGLLPDIVALTIAGGIAGGFQGYVLSPILLLKTRAMTNPVFRTKMTLLRSTILSFSIGLSVVKNEGLTALMKGSNIFALKRVFDWSTRYYFSDVIESIMISSGFGLNSVLSPKEKILASLLGGTASTIVTLPLDVIVAKSQDAKKAGVKVSAWDTFMKDYETGGWKGLYDANMMGFEARLAHVCFTTVVMKTGSGIMYDFLFGETNKVA